MLKNRFDNGNRQPVAKCYGDCFAANNLYRGLFHPFCKRSLNLSVEHGSHHADHYGQPCSDNNLYRNRDQFQRLFTNGFGNSLCELIS